MKPNALLSGILLLLLAGETLGAQSVTPSAGEASAPVDSRTDPFRGLPEEVKSQFNAGNLEAARKRALEGLALAPEYRNDWSYGNVIHDCNMVLGRIAVREGKLQDAKQYLHKAGETPGSCNLGSFGPNMSLAKDLLEKGEWDAVLEYFAACRKFGSLYLLASKLDRWTQAARAKQIPEFGANLDF